MEVVISNKSKQGVKQINVSTNNAIGKVNFSKVAKASSIELSQLADVIVPVTIQNGAVLTYNSANSVYILQNSIDGGVF